MVIAFLATMASIGLLCRPGAWARLMCRFGWRRRGPASGSAGPGAGVAASSAPLVPFKLQLAVLVEQPDATLTCAVLPDGSNGKEEAGENVSSSTSNSWQSSSKSSGWGQPEALGRGGDVPGGAAARSSQQQHPQTKQRQRGRHTQEVQLVEPGQPAAPSPSSGGGGGAAGAWGRGQGAPAPSRPQQAADAVSR